MNSESGVVLWWLPVGAGGHVAVRTSRWWELLRARREHRRPAPLFHAALEVSAAGDRYVIEMAPAWGGPVGDRGVVACGPVGARVLGVSRFFRYEVRCWRDGVIPDLAWAVGGPVRFALPPEGARTLIHRTPEVPLLTWGRDPFDLGDMWNSNSLAAWLLQTSGIDASAVSPPNGGAAPGWLSGIAAAVGSSLR
ncbi:MAG: hypothetical protein QM809_13975 [Gordonia sp. (in: high G+C Gram-positive bacteria)]|uniref:hypothetical protein n=1 Tax=Gordonia sp. (in: high G+C Gram-positive bacteria) TaxID=84139 RepID=UPI0039E2C8A7